MPAPTDATGTWTTDGKTLVTAAPPRPAVTSGDGRALNCGLDGTMQSW
jgi:hypothetical protein